HVGGPPTSASSGWSTVGSNRRPSDVSASGSDGLVRLHQRLSHMGFDRMMKLLRSGKVEGLQVGSHSQRDVAVARTQVLQCRACILGKQARTSFDHRGLERGQAPAEILHMDTFLVRCVGPDGIMRTQYGISIMDVYSREGWQAV